MFTPQPWSVVVDGECMKPGTYAYEDIISPHQLEERIYRLRCVEAWSMVIPLGRGAAGRRAEAVRTHVTGKIRGLYHRHAADRGNAGPQAPGAGLALPGGIAY